MCGIIDISAGILSVSQMSVKRDISSSTAFIDVLKTSTGMPLMPGALSHFIFEMHARTSSAVSAGADSELRLLGGTSTLYCFVNFPPFV